MCSRESLGLGPLFLTCSYLQGSYLFSEGRNPGGAPGEGLHRIFLSFPGVFFNVPMYQGHFVVSFTSILSFGF